MLGAVSKPLAPGSTAAAAAGIAMLISIIVAGPIGLVLPLIGVLFLFAGSKELLGPLQPVHAVVDAYLSLLIASVRLMWGDVDVKWDIDEGMREGL